MAGFIEAAFAKYAWIWIGLTFGIAAKYALLLKRGVKVTARLVLADLLLLPLVALIAYGLCSRAGLDSETAALATAFCTVGADRIVKLLTERFYRQFEAVALRDVAASATEATGELRNAVQKVESAKSIMKGES